MRRANRCPGLISVQILLAYPATVGFHSLPPNPVAIRCAEAIAACPQFSLSRSPPPPAPDAPPRRGGETIPATAFLLLLILLPPTLHHDHQQHLFLPSLLLLRPRGAVPSSGSPRHLSLPTSLRRDSFLDLARILKSSLQCHLALRTLTSQTPPLHARFAAASRLAFLSPALRPFASLLLAALLPAASPHLLAWCASPGGAPYAALRLALHAFLAAGMPAEALVVLARIRSARKTPSLSALATLLRLLFREGNVQAAWKVFVEMTAMEPRPSVAIFNAMILGLCHRGLVPVAAGLLGVMWRFHVIPDACSYNILIKGHCVFGQAGNAFELFEKMHKSGCEPTVVTYNILVW
ncbi:hypothetical protein ZWY2020_048588 [Hordeum vulgare]|nr:hypothetical protein ZWY2020_048588 [Hordeum vulgare]